MKTGEYEARESVTTLSNAMDVGDPSNFVRILQLVEGDRAMLANSLLAVSVSDDETGRTMKQVFSDSSYALDPHGAIGYRALADHLAENPGSAGIFLETAHRAKFESVNDIIGNYDVVPAALTELSARPQHRIEIDADYDALRSVLLARIQDGGPGR
jgi:threonine synthase